MAKEFDLLKQMPVGSTIGPLRRAVRPDDPSVLARPDSEQPELWIGTSSPEYFLESLQSIPVDSAVMIGSTIDLTDTIYLQPEKRGC